MKKFGLLTIAVAAATLIGCGASKSYVEQQIAASEARTSAKIASAESRTDSNADQIARLQALSNELAGMTEVLINKASGYEDYEVVWESSVPYDFESYKVNDAADRALVECAGRLAAENGSILEIAGHTDMTGSEDYNLELGEKRAQAVRRFLAESYGVSLYRMFAISYGEEHPLVREMNRKANAKNRRATLKVWANPANSTTVDEKPANIDPSL